MNGALQISAERLKRRYALARRPLAILALLHGGEDRLARASLRELREWTDGIAAAIRREREKGAAGHWSYDLNRHIALKAARDRLGAEIRRRETARS